MKHKGEINIKEGEKDQINSRIPYVDYAKAIGIILVIWGHVKGLCNFDSLSFITKGIYSFHMPLFFTITGMCLFYKFQRNEIYFRNEVKKLCLHLLVPFYTWSILYMLPAILVTRTATVSSIQERLWAMISLRGAAPIWFLAALFIGEVIVIGILKITQKQHIYLRISIVLVGIVTILVNEWYKVFVQENTMILILYPLITVCRNFFSVFFLLIGYEFANVLFTMEKKDVVKIAVSSFVILIILQLVVELGNNMHTNEYKSAILFLVTGILGSFWVIGSSFCLPDKMTGLSKIGTKSFDLMVLHYPPVPTIKILGTIGIQSCSIICILTIFITLVVSFFVNKLREYIKRKGYIVFF